MKAPQPEPAKLSRLRLEQAGRKLKKQDRKVRRFIEAMKARPK